MDENKDILNEQAETVNETAENISEEITEEATEETVEISEETRKTKKTKKAEKAPKRKKLKNQALFKKGGYSLIITALVLAALVLVNWLVVMLSERYHLEFDMSSQKINSISEDNLKYIKGVEKDVEIIICSDEDNYASNMSYYAANMYNASGEADYFEQTVNLINKYGDYNKHIKVRFVDPQSTEFTEITTKYSSLNLAYGDIIVAGKNGDKERNKKIGFSDIYATSDESGYAAMGYGSYTISGNNIETALTGAVAYAVSDKTKKVGLITGHSVNDNTANYVTLLKDNNYETETISDAMITSVPDDCDVLAIVTPSVDFLGSELDIISDFLDNDGKLGKGLVYFGDASSPVLSNLNEFLAQWGIDVHEGILFETDAKNHIENDPITMGIYPGEDEATEGMGYCISGYNIPITAGTPAEATVETKELMLTSETVAIAPVGVAPDWNGYTNDDLGQFAGVIEAVQSDYDEDNNPVSSYVMAFSSIEYITSDWAEYQQLSNKDITLAATDIAAQVGDSGVSFISKTITNESFADSVTAAGSNTIRVIFMIALPICMIILGIYIFIRRKNA